MLCAWCKARITVDEEEYFNDKKYCSSHCVNMAAGEQRLKDRYEEKDDE
jgi:hypothetical protein